MSISTDITTNCSPISHSNKQDPSHWTAEQCRAQNTLILAGCNLAERLEMLLTLPGAESLLNYNNYPITYLKEAIQHWYSMGDRWMEAFGEI